VLDMERARREIVEQVDAIHKLEGFDPESAPQWFHDLTEAYIQGKVTAEQATQLALARITETPIFIDSNEPLELPAFVSFASETLVVPEQQTLIDHDT
jgi:Antitoxin VbhA